MPLYRLKYGDPKLKKYRKLLSIDSEWAKNWKAQPPIPKIDPFCTTIFSVYYPTTQPKQIDLYKLYFEATAYFRDSSQSLSDYIDTVESLLTKQIDNKTIVIGHQITSDLHTFVNLSKHNLPTISKLIKLFHKRKEIDISDEILNMRDTRYDIKNRIIGNGQERLREVALRLNVLTPQTELDKMSLTKMYNLYLQDHDKEKLEKLMIMNIRHAFMQAVVFLVDTIYPQAKLYDKHFKLPYLFLNDILYYMSKNDFDYVNSTEFRETSTLDLAYRYVKKWQPKHGFVKRLEKSINY